MPISLICGACDAPLTAPDAAAGKRVKCRKCGAILEVPLPEPDSHADFEVIEEAPTMMMPPIKKGSVPPLPAAKVPPPAAAKPLPQPAKPKPRPVEMEIDEDDEDDRPTPKRKSKPVIAADDYDEDDFDDEPRPKTPKPGKSKKAAGMNMPLVLGGATVAVALIGVLFWYFVIREPEYTFVTPPLAPQDSGVKGAPPLIPPGKGGGMPGKGGNPPAGEPKLVTTDLSKYGVPVTMELPAGVKITNTGDTEYPQLEIELDKKTTAFLSAPENATLATWKANNEKLWPGMRVIEEDATKCYWESDVKAGPVDIRAAGMCLAFSAGGKQYLIHAQGTEITRAQSDLSWRGLKSIKPK